MDSAHIRNFSIIAHIDHGKTTLSDRLLNRTGTIADRDMSAQLLDSMDLEKERGITIKAHPVTMLYTAKSGEIYELNLIDTPGHVDFSYEVSRSLSACEGALLIIDAAQGVEAQTVANVHLAMKQNLHIIPVINKIDLPHADVALTKQQLEDILAIPAETALLASAKAGIGIDDILEAIVARIPPPKPSGERSLQALAFDSYFDTYKGVVTHVRVFNGELRAGQHVKLLHSGQNVDIKEVGSFNPKPYVREKLEVGETGYFTANIKSPQDVKMGDTITDARIPSPVLPGFKVINAERPESKFLSVGLASIFCMMATLELPAQTDKKPDAPANQTDVPKEQEQFVAAVEPFIGKYLAAQNEVKKTLLRTQRKAAIKGALKGVGSEWRLVKAQNFLGEALAPPGIGRGDEDDSAGNALHLLDDLP